jgi:hypothetical protein
MANNKDFKVKNGIKPTAYYETVGTVTSGSENYNMTGASYDSVNLDVSSQTVFPQDVFFKPDGTKMFTTGVSGTTYTVNEYSLSTAYDLSTASFTQSFSTASQEQQPRSIWFKTDGTKMFVLGPLGDDVNEYTLSTAWSLTSVSFVDSFSVASQDLAPYGLTFSADGTQMYTCGLFEDDVIQYTLSTAWDVSSASYTRNLVITSVEPNPRDVQFNSDGTAMFISGSTNGLHKYTLTTGYDISTASFDSTSSITSDTQPEPAGFFIKSDGSKVWVGDQTDKIIYQYSLVQPTNTLDLSTGSVFEITPTSDVQVTVSNPAASGTVSSATLLLEPSFTGYAMDNAAYVALQDPIAATFSSIFSVRFDTTGTKLYIAGNNGSSNGISQHTLSTAWDITSVNTTADHFYNSDGSNNILDFFFKPDGTKLYTMGYTQDRVYQHSLSTAWDISTASYESKSFSVATQDATPHSLFFKPDGTKFYMSGNSVALNEYTMTTAWDVSTASYTTASGSLTGSTQYAIAFIPDGTKVYMMGASGVLYGYTLSTAWDASTLNTSYFLSYDAQTAAAGNRPYALTFSEDGEYWYGADQTEIIQYSSYAMPTITYDSSVEFSGGTAPTSPDIGETDVITFSTRDGGTTYQAVQAIDGAK